MGAFGCASPLKDGSTARTSGSQKQTFGAPFGPKSRGRLVTVLAGAAPLPWPNASPAASATALAPRPARNRRRPRLADRSPRPGSLRPDNSCLVVVAILVLPSLTLTTRADFSPRAPYG